VPERRVPKVVRKRDRFDQILVKTQAACDVRATSHHSLEVARLARIARGLRP